MATGNIVHRYISVANMVICCVVNCTDGTNNSQRFSKYSFPQDPELCAKWLEAIPMKSNISKKKLFVCEQHFADTDLIRYWQSGTGSMVYRIPYKFPKLRGNAIPSIFFGTKQRQDVPQNNPCPTQGLYFVDSEENDEFD